MSSASVPIERHVRSRDPESSWAAAKIDRESWSELQRRITDILRVYGPSTDDEIFRAYTDNHSGNRTPQRVRTARQELTLAGAVRRFDDLGQSTLGHKAQRWAVVQS